MIMIMMTLTWGTGDGGTALVLGLFHHTVLTHWLDKWAHPRKYSVKIFLSIIDQPTSKNTWAFGYDMYNLDRVHWLLSALPHCSVCTDSNNLKNMILNLLCALTQCLNAYHHLEMLALSYYSNHLQELKKVANIRCIQSGAIIGNFVCLNNVNC